MLVPPTSSIPIVMLGSAMSRFRSLVRTPSGKRTGLRPLGIDVHHAGELQAHPGLGRDGVAFFADQLGHAGPDGAEPDQPNSYMLLIHQITFFFDWGSR